MLNFPLNRIHLDTVDSTNNFAKRLIAENKITQGTVIAATEQTQGRGRLGRSWLSDGGKTLCMSVVIKSEKAEGITLLAALALHKALSDFCKSKEFLIKWPNDIIYKRKKLCGILCEGAGEYIVIGIGVNVNSSCFPDEIKEKATSLKNITGKDTDISEVEKKICAELESVLKGSDYTFKKPEREQYISLCANIGRGATTAFGNGVAVGIAEDGSLLVRNDSAQLFSVNSGEVAVYDIY